MEIRIITQTDFGEQALKKHVEESLKLGFKNKLMMKQLGIRQEVTKTTPYTLTLRLTNKRLSSLIRPDLIIMQIDEAMQLNGAKKDEDYIIEVIQ